MYILMTIPTLSKNLKQQKQLFDHINQMLQSNTQSLFHCTILKPVRVWEPPQADFQKNITLAIVLTTFSYSLKTTPF